jgi:hypothetical protein
MTKLRLFFRHFALLALLAALVAPYLVEGTARPGEVSPQVNWNSGSM